MKKYFETAKILFKTQLVYRFDIITGTVFTVSKILLAYVLWGAIFGKESLVSGFTFNSMLSYYIISSFITQLDQSANTGQQIASEIKNGRFSKYITKPMNIFGYFSAQTAGVTAFLLFFNLIAAVMWFFLFRIDFMITGNSGNILSAIGLVILGQIFMMQLNYCIGILAFKFIDIDLFMMIKDNLVEFVRGALIPLALLPLEIIKLMTFFPFYYVSYLPTMVLLGRNETEIATGIVTLLCWNAALGLLNSIIYQKLRLNYEGVGI
jgi:ABC-2 type transport system permease protein